MRGGLGRGESARMAEVDGVRRQWEADESFSPGRHKLELIRVITVARAFTARCSVHVL